MPDWQVPLILLTEQLIPESRSPARQRCCIRLQVGAPMHGLFCDRYAQSLSFVHEYLHIWVQPSSSMALPSSHCSGVLPLLELVSTKPSPHFFVTQLPLTQISGVFASPSPSHVVPLGAGNPVTQPLASAPSASGAHISSPLQALPSLHSSNWVQGVLAFSSLS